MEKGWTSQSRFVVFNGAGAGHGTTNLIALIEAGRVVASRRLAGRGASEQFAPVTQDLLRQVSWSSAPDAVLAVVGPGSFTGLRASLALASGLACGWGCPGVGVSLGAALRGSLRLHHGVEEPVSVLCLARRGRIFVDSPECGLSALPIEEIKPGLWSAVAGDAVSGEDRLEALTGQDEKTGQEKILASGAAKKIYRLAVPDALGVLYAACEAQRMGGILPLVPAYIDPPEARLPASGLRPAPI